MLYWDFKNALSSVICTPICPEIFQEKAFGEKKINSIINILHVTNVTHIVEMGINTEGTQPLSPRSVGLETEKERHNVGKKC